MAIDPRLRAYTNTTATGLPFAVMQLNAEEKAVWSLPPGFPQAGKEASGKVTVWRYITAAPSKTTNQYQISNKGRGKGLQNQGAISVPGMGMTEAMVYADQAGRRI